MSPNLGTLPNFSEKWLYQFPLLLSLGVARAQSSKGGYEANACADQGSRPIEARLRRGTLLHELVSTYLFEVSARHVATACIVGGEFQSGGPLILRSPERTKHPVGVLSGLSLSDLHFLEGALRNAIIVRQPEVFFQLRVRLFGRQCSVHVSIVEEQEVVDKQVEAS